MSSNMIFNTLLLLTAVTAQPPPPQQQQQEESACSWSYYQQCGWQNTNGVRTATSDSFVTFGVTSSKPDMYSATVTFFNSPFTPSSNNPNNNDNEPREYEVISTGSQVYPTNSNITKSNTFTYTSYGYYKLGYNLTFGEGSGYCTDKTFGVEGWIYVDESSCEFGTIMEEETTASAATAATSTAATVASSSLGVEDIADAAPVPIGEPEGAVSGNEETATTTTITNTDNTNNNNAAATPLMYNNPEGNNFFCGYSFDTVSSSCLQSKPCGNGVGVGVCGDTEGCFKVDMCESEYEVAGRVVVDTTTTTTTVATTTTGATVSSATTSQPVSTTTTSTEAVSVSSSSSSLTTTSASTTDMSSSTTSSAASSTSATAAPSNNEEVLVEYDEDYPRPPSADEPEEANGKNQMNFANSGDYSSAADTLHCYYFRGVMVMMIGWCVLSLSF